MSIINFIKESDNWLLSKAPLNHVVVSSRARLARNLPHLPFALRAQTEQLQEVMHRVDEAIAESEYFQEYKRLAISEIHSLYRLYLKESHLISTEFEKGGEHRIVYISPDYRVSILINEEDHIRIQCLETGGQLSRVLAVCEEVESELARHLQFATSPKLGYLTACPTNVGSGLRVSVMAHLPGLVVIDRVEEILESVKQYGMTVRGMHGEHSDYQGDLFQLSNEVTLGKADTDIRETLESVMRQIVERESNARDALFDQKDLLTKDLISRALATLQNARILDSGEALAHLSKIRLGIDRGYFKDLDHSSLSRLMVEVLPAHLQCQEGGQIPAERRDSVRADLIHQRLKGLILN